MANTESHLKSLGSEVKDFHPILKTLFEAMPDIYSVEYKQGNQENGADFVLTKKSLLPSRREYVGVIVKTGPITKSDHKVFLQIEECIVTSRVVEKKKEIHLDEIWVVTNGVISVSAQEFISGKFRAQKVTFYGLNDVAEIIDTYLPDIFDSAPVQLINYFKEE